jgi:hypothetical protein
MSQVASTCQRFFGATAKQMAHAAPFGPHPFEAHRFSPVPSDDDEIDPRRKQTRPRPKALSAETFDPVPDHRDADLPRHDEADPRGRLRIDAPLAERSGSDEQDEVSRRDPPRRRLDM